MAHALCKVMKGVWELQVALDMLEFEQSGGFEYLEVPLPAF